MPQQIIKWLLLFLFSWSLTALAVEPDQVYQFEIIIYSHINEASLRSEYWPSPASLKIPANAMELSDEALNESQWLLKPTDQILKRNNNTLLLHAAWQLSAADAQKGVVLHINGGKNYEGHDQELNGFLAINLDRYFNLNFNLRFLLPWENVQNLNLNNIDKDPENPYIVFSIDKKLRMRSNELNYIDHPLYSVLFKIQALDARPGNPAQ